MVETTPIIDSTILQIQITSFIFGSIISFFTFYISNEIIWTKLKNEMAYHKSERLLYHYNLCLRLIDNKDYTKALKTYNKLFGKSNQPIAHIIRVALKVLRGDSLKDEIITMENIV